ncbi:MAG TPA: DUF1080 domain-containing protein [Planctomycetaceae bacterium]|nr:DUF1080 domain-containing protein [Planctomycetaceae bacterium]
MRRADWRLLAVFAAAYVIAGLETNRLDAADKKFAATDLSQVDSDFQYQGEYLGSVVEESGYSVCFGLQVVAEGQGQFRGVTFRGGLPGYGWDETTRAVYHGTLGDGGVHLTGGPLQIVITVGRAEVSDTHGRRLGELTHVERRSSTLGAPPPAGAQVLFDGTDRDTFVKPKITADGLLQIGTETKQPMQDFYLHLEFRTPYMPQARGQGRGNSGVYLQGRYEVQILDSFGLEGKNNEAGALYQTVPPRINMALPPLAWQTYDIDFRAARFDADGKKTTPARLTVYHNGVVVQNALEVPHKTGAGAAEGPNPRPTKLQDHGDPVRFRNIWLVEYSTPPATATPACNAVANWPAPCGNCCGRMRRCRNCW